MTNTAPPSLLDNLLSGDAFPFTVAFDGDYKGIEIRYREIPRDAASQVVEAIRPEAEALHLDPHAVVLSALSPDGDALTGTAFISHAEAVDALNPTERAALGAAVLKISGVICSLVIGEWNAQAPITPETCSKLPTSLQDQIISLSQAKTLGAEEKN